MRSPEKILNSLIRHSEDLNYKFERVYRILFNEEMYLMAYQKLQGKIGNMTQGVDGKTIDGMSIPRIEQLIQSLKDESYQPKPTKRVYIPKKNGDKRPLGIPSFEDKLLQEVVRMILESIYEKSFEDTSHGFRPQRSCHTALNHIQRTYTGTKWFIEGDIKGFFDSINHSVLINILKERIADERFIRLMRKFLNAGYIEDWKFYQSYSGTPQGGIISPILANIYLDKLDKYINKYVSEFNMGNYRAYNKEYKRLIYLKSKLQKELENETNEDVKKQLIALKKAVAMQYQSISSRDWMDSKYKRLRYTRYADDFLIGIIGSKADCVKVKADIKDYLTSQLSLELSEDKTLITNAHDTAKFLGFDICTRKSDDLKRNKNGVPMKCWNGKVMLSVNMNVLKDKLLKYEALKIVTIKGKEVWKAKERTYLINNDELEILMQYNAEIRGLYNYYCIANNSCTINFFYSIMKWSMLKTYAAKFKSNVRRTIKKYTRDKVFTITYQNKKGKIKHHQFYHEGFKRRKFAEVQYSDELPQTVQITGGRNGLIARLKAQKCEICNSTENIEVHHVRKLKDLKGKMDWEKRMIARNRKTLILCSICHQKLHAGLLD